MDPPPPVCRSNVNIVENIFSTFSTLSPGTRARLLNTHGHLRGFMLFLFLRPAYDQLDRMEDHVVWAKEDVVEKCRQTYIQECTMSAIAGTIIAQVALTSLVLPNLSQVHWIARSAFLLSLVSGCLAVYYASLLQRKLGNFRTPEQVREWWRCSRSIEREAHLATPALRPTHLEDANSETQVDFERTLLAIVQSWGDKEGPKLQASVAAAILMSSPSMMINFALGAFLTGIGVYLGFVWQNDLDTIAGKSESRNVFICFLTSLVFCYTFYILPSLSKLWEDNKKPTRKTRQLEERIERTFPAVRRIWALSRLERLQPEMMSNLLPDLKKLATGARSSDWDDRWIVEAIETMKSFDTILDGWDFAKLEALMVEVKEKEQKEKRKRMMRVLMERFVVRTNWRESHKTFGESTALNETKNKTEDEQGNEVDDKTNKTKDIDLESGILGGQST